MLDHECDKVKVCPVSLGIALGFVKGMYMLLLAWVAWLFGYGSAMVDHISSFMSGYSASLMGGIKGGVWGFVCGFVFGFVFAYVYNFVCSRCKKS